VSSICLFLSYSCVDTGNRYVKAGQVVHMHVPLTLSSVI